MLTVKPLLKRVNPKTFINDYLRANGIQDVDKYLHPDASCFDRPEDYPNIDEGAIRLNQAIVKKERVGVLQDSDGDGVMSTVIACDFLKKQGVEYQVFFHVGKQHGLRKSIEENLVEQIKLANIELLWVPDAGSSDEAEAKELKNSGVDVLITDHHLFNKNKEAIVINCCAKDNLNHNLTGAGVTDKLIEYYCKKYSIVKPDYSDLVAFSIVSDVMDLTEKENRAYIYFANK